MTEFMTHIDHINTDHNKVQHMNEIIEAAHAAGYTEVDVNTDKPWGAFVRFDDANAAQFIADFFPGLTLEEAQLGVDNAPLSPKILLVSPSQRLSLQTHDRRAERWRFLTPGEYYKGTDNETAQLYHAEAGDSVQFGAGDLHRLCGSADGTTLVAEIWQHTEPSNLSNEDDITRLEDDYAR